MTDCYLQPCYLNDCFLCRCKELQERVANLEKAYEEVKQEHAQHKVSKIGLVKSNQRICSSLTDIKIK